MIFVTVGTHEQPFNRLIEKIDKLVENSVIKEEVIVQYGYSTYIPKHCKAYKLIGYDEMNKYMEDARIVITHGGPASFIAPLTIGKVPIVIPRMKEYEEHVNNHQVEFVKQVSNRYNSIIAIYDIEKLEQAILEYDEISKKMLKNYNSNNENFCNELEKTIEELYGGKNDFRK